jgi:hypothetical protein
MGHYTWWLATTLENDGRAVSRWLILLSDTVRLYGVLGLWVASEF